MSMPIRSTPDNLAWKRAYMAAVLEKDRTRLPELIEEANQRLCERLLELTVLGQVPSVETEAIHDAIYLLQALRSSLLYREDEAGGWIQSDQEN